MTELIKEQPEYRRYSRPIERLIADLATDQTGNEVLRMLVNQALSHRSEQEVVEMLEVLKITGVTA